MTAWSSAVMLEPCLKVLCVTGPARTAWSPA